MIKSNVVITELEDNVYEVTPAPIKIAVGKRFRISPSYGYAGIDPGIVEVVSIVTKEEYELDTHKYPQIEEFINIEEGMTEDTVDYSLWIGYKYTQPEQQYTDYLPIDQFIQHISLL